MKKKIIIILLVIAAVLGFAQISKAQEKFNCDDSIVVVKPGQTLWQIGNKHCTGNVQIAVDKMVRQYGSNIKVGQKIQLP